MPDQSTPQVVIQPRRGWFQRGLWLLDNYGRWLTMTAVVGVAAGAAAITASIVRAISKLPPWPWLFFLWGGVGLVVFVIGAIAVLSIVGGKVIPSDFVGACQVYSPPKGDFLRLIAPVMLTNTDRDWSLLPTHVRARRVTFDGKRKGKPFKSGFVVCIDDSSKPFLAPGRTGRYQIALDCPAPPGGLAPNPRVVLARIDIRDQFQRWHHGRGRFEFAQVPNAPPHRSPDTEKGGGDAPTQP